jgi:hypothetical protein
MDQQSLERQVQKSGMSDFDFVSDDDGNRGNKDSSTRKRRRHKTPVDAADDYLPELEWLYSCVDQKRSRHDYVEDIEREAEEEDEESFVFGSCDGDDGQSQAPEILPAPAVEECEGASEEKSKSRKTKLQFFGDGSMLTVLVVGDTMDDVRPLGTVVTVSLEGRQMRKQMRKQNLELVWWSSKEGKCVPALKETSEPWRLKTRASLESVTLAAFSRTSQGVLPSVE